MLKVSQNRTVVEKFGYHQLGERIVTDSEYKKWGQNTAGRVLQGLAKDLNMSERTLYYAIKFYEAYPQLDKVPEGKNNSWNKIITIALDGNFQIPY